MLGVLPLLWLDLRGNLDLALRPYVLLEQDLLVPLQLCLLSLLLILGMPLPVPLLLLLQLLVVVDYGFLGLVLVLIPLPLTLLLVVLLRFHSLLHLVIIGLFLILKLSTT